MKHGTLNNFSWKKKTNKDDMNMNDARDDDKNDILDSQSIKQSALKGQESDSNYNSDRKYNNLKRKGKKNSQIEYSEAAFISVTQDQSQSQERILSTSFTGADTVLNTKKRKAKRKCTKQSTTVEEKVQQQIQNDHYDGEEEEEFVYLSKKERVLVQMKSMKKKNIIDSDETDSNEHNINIDLEQQSSSQQSSSGIRKKLKMEVDVKENSIIGRRQLIVGIEEDKVDKDGLVILHPVEYTPVKYLRGFDSPVRLQSQRINNKENIQQQLQRQERQPKDNMNNTNNNSMSIVIDLEDSDDGEVVEIMDPQKIDRNPRKRKINIIRSKMKDQQEAKQEIEEYDNNVIEDTKGYIDNGIRDSLGLVPIVAVFKGTGKQNGLFINNIDNHDDFN